ncbi:MAG: uridine diphosphate-N-acetylglucosamine-binding protein YvcK [Actinomycetota bacterium]|nr:uridine diphosphate-N-acetylglucosamine-binding protein YvcK [Actinomycetota bacterium]
MSKVVCLGGGHGLAATLSALRSITSQITAIVTVADNGGSSGRLRQEFPIFPPGDLRMALAALCADDEWGRTWAQIMQHRFVSDGALDGHAMGNLLLASLWSEDEDPIIGLDRVGSLLKTVGRVLPMASVPLDIEATFITSTGRIVVRGQKEVATAKGRIESLRVIPQNPMARIEALTAIRVADWITMGPGSWFSSVMPHLLVPMQLDALVRTKAKKILILNLDAHANTAGEEFAGSTPEEHLALFHHYAPDVSIDYFLVDQSVVRERKTLTEMASKLGGQVVAADIRKAPGSIHHDVEKLALHFSHIMRQSLVG